MFGMLLSFLIDNFKKVTVETVCLFVFWTAQFAFGTTLNFTYTFALPVFKYAEI